MAGDGPGQGPKPTLDDDGLFAERSKRTLTFLDDAALPRELVRHLLDLGGIRGLFGAGAVKLADRGVHVAERFLLGAGEPADAVDRVASRPVRLVEDPGEQHGQGFLAVTLDLLGEAVHRLSGLV